MKDMDNLCLSCFKELTEGAVCADCGYDNDTPADTQYLAPKTVLEDRYFVGALLGHESDAATYAGFDMQINKRITIREFYPKGMASRMDDSDTLHIRERYTASVAKYKESFISLWTTLEKMHNRSAVVPVYDVFEANNTVYAVIEHMESITLREYLLRGENSYISWDTARLMFMPVLTTLEALHSNDIVHGSITPDNLVLCRDGKVRLSAFPIQECTDASTDLAFTENAGYTALEQYDNAHKIGPATDIYAFSACIYRALVGSNPPSATEREANDKLMIPNSIAETIPMHVIKALGSGLQVYPEKRTQSISHFRELLDAAPSVKAKSMSTTELETAEHRDYALQERAFQRQQKRSRTTVIILVILIILAIAAGIYVVKFTNLLRPEPTTAPVSQEIATYEVPNFASGEYTQSDVENNGAWNTQFVLNYVGEYSTEYEAGIIFKQSVAAGETVEANTTITLTVSKGIETRAVPKVAGQPLEDAKKQLEELGFTVKVVEVYNDGGHKPNTVRDNYATSPAEGEAAAVGEEILLQVYGEVQTTTQPATDANN